MTSPQPLRPARGFTLIELLVVMAMIAIIAAVATPSLRAFASNQALKAVTSDLLGAANVAKNTALTQNSTVIVAPISGTDWTTGWRVFVDNDGSNTWTNGDKLVIEREPPPDGIVKETASMNNCSDINLFAFGPDGFLKPIGSNFNGGIRFKSAVTSQNRCVVLSKVGAARICGTGGGASAC